MKLDGLTFIRFIAALWVFIFHVNLRLPLGAPGPIDNIISNGALAMPLFFMLSGFVLAYKYNDAYKSLNLFFRARVARIYPAYLVSIVAALPFLFLQKNVDLTTGLLVLPIDLLLLQAWYPNLWSFWHHAGTWSISVEFFLYAAFPLLLSLAKLSSRSLMLICVGCTLLAGSYIPSLRLGPLNRNAI